MSDNEEYSQHTHSVNRNKWGRKTSAEWCQIIV